MNLWVWLSVKRTHILEQSAAITTIWGEVELGFVERERIGVLLGETRTSNDPAGGKMYFAMTHSVRCATGKKSMKRKAATAQLS